MPGNDGSNSVVDAEIFELNCPHCDKLYKLPREKVIKHAGKSIHCRRCGQPFSIPELPEEPVESDFGPTAPETAESQPVHDPVPAGEESGADSRQEEDSSYFAGVTAPAHDEHAVAEPMAGYAPAEVDAEQQTFTQSTDSHGIAAFEAIAAETVEETPVQATFGGESSGGESSSGESISEQTSTRESWGVATEPAPEMHIADEPAPQRVVVEDPPRRSRRSKKSTASPQVISRAAEPIETVTPAAEQWPSAELTEPAADISEPEQSPPEQFPPEQSPAEEVATMGIAPIVTSQPAIVPPAIHVMPAAAVRHLAAIRRSLAIGAAAMIIIALAAIVVALSAFGVLPHR